MNATSSVISKDAACPHCGSDVFVVISAKKEAAKFRREGNLMKRESVYFMDGWFESAMCEQCGGEVDIETLLEVSEDK